MSGLGYKRCWQCGAENADDRTYCGVCGEELDSKELIDRLNSRQLTIEELTKLRWLLEIISIDGNKICINGTVIADNIITRS